MAYNHSKTMCDVEGCVGEVARIGASGTALCENCYREKLIAEVFEHIPEEVEDGQGGEGSQSEDVRGMCQVIPYEWAGIVGTLPRVYQAG